MLVDLFFLVVYVVVGDWLWFGWFGFVYVGIFVGVGWCVGVFGIDLVYFGVDCWVCVVIGGLWVW